MNDLYLVARDAILAAWNAGWTRTDVPVLWRSGDILPKLDPLNGGSNGGTPHFFRNEIDFGREEVIGFGGGRFSNFRCQFGSVIIRSFASLTIGEEEEALQLLSAATAVFRSYRARDANGGDLSFIGTGSGFDWGPTEDGVWFVRGVLTVFEYRFPG